jgi:uncharacterized repeat protein (TIGR03803 family)
MGRLQKLYNVVNEPMLPNAVILARGICGFPPLEGNMRSFRLASVYALIFAQGMFGQAFKTLAVFDGTNGSTPEGAFTQGANGSLYSTTYTGGGHSAGTVFKMTPAGALTTLYSFTGAGSGVGDGSGPYSAPVLATSGNFYGTTPYAGASGFYGTVYQISPSGTLTTLCRQGTATAAATDRSSGPGAHHRESEAHGQGTYHVDGFGLIGEADLGRFLPNFSQFITMAGDEQWQDMQIGDTFEGIAFDKPVGLTRRS